MDVLEHRWLTRIAATALGDPFHQGALQIMTFPLGIPRLVPNLCFRLTVLIVVRLHPLNVTNSVAVGDRGFVDGLAANGDKTQLLVSFIGGRRWNIAPAHIIKNTV